MARTKKPTLKPLSITQADIEEARGWHEVIKANVERWYSDAITHAAFSENQRQLWDTIGTKSIEVREALAELMLDALRAPRAAA